MNALQNVREQLSPGSVYRRADIERWSNAVDRHLTQLQKDKTLVKLSGGLYYCPRETVFGMVPPQDFDLVRAFLKDHRFLLMSPNLYNTLGVGTTQLYNETIVYNHKRHGQFMLGTRVFHFMVKPYFPLEATSEFLLVDLVDNLDRLAEDRHMVLKLIVAKAETMDKKRLQLTVQEYGGVQSRKFFQFLMETGS